jgi:hypothetical protein
MEIPIRFETFQAVSFVLAGSLFLYFLIRLTGWSIKRVFKRRR